MNKAKRSERMYLLADFSVRRCLVEALKQKGEDKKAAELKSLPKLNNMDRMWEAITIVESIHDEFDNGEMIGGSWVNKGLISSIAFLAKTCVRMTFETSLQYGDDHVVNMQEEASRYAHHAALKVGLEEKLTAKLVKKGLVIELPDVDYNAHEDGHG